MQPNEFTYYYIPDHLRTRLILDVNRIDGNPIRSLDEYLLSFPISRKLIYEYLKYTDKPVRISYLHSIFNDQSNDLWFERPEIKKDPVAVKVVTKCVYDQWTWKYGVREIMNTIFDAKYLLLQASRLRAHKATDLYMTCGKTHRIQDLTSLRNPAIQKTHDQYLIDRREVTKNFFENIVLKDTNFGLEVKINYMYDFIEIYNERSKMTFRHELNQNMRNNYMLVYPSGYKLTKKRTTYNNFELMKFVRKNPEIFKVIDNIQDNLPEIFEYHRELYALRKKYDSTFRQMKATFEAILKDFMSKENCLDVKKLGVISVHPGTVETNWITINPNNFRYTMTKSTYYCKDDEYSDNVDKGWQRITTRALTYTPPTGNNISALAEHLINLGAMNIYHWLKEPKLNEFLLLAKGKLDHRQQMLFCQTPVLVGIRALDTYNERFTEVQLSAKSHSEGKIIPKHEKPETLNTLTSLSPRCYTELYYRNNWPLEYKKSHKIRVETTETVLTEFKTKYKDLLTLDARILHKRKLDAMTTEDRAKAVEKLNKEKYNTSTPVR